jgi:hypothetical protein
VKEERKRTIKRQKKEREREGEKAYALKQKKRYAVVDSKT